MSLAQQGLGCAPILLTAEIKGPETEQWYCPRIEWTLPDGTTASQESDCPPFEEREEFQRIWRHRVCAPPHPRGDEWAVEVRLSKGKWSVRQEVRFLVR